MEFATKIGMGVTALAFSMATYATDPAPIKAGVFELIPELTVDGKFDDNIFKSFTDERDDYIIEINPRLEAVVQSRNNSFSMAFDWKEGLYQDYDDDDYSDWMVDADVHLEANAKNMFDLYAGFHKLHEDRGSGFSQGELVFLINHPDVYEETIYGGAYTFGSEATKGRLKLAADVLEKEYTRYPTEQVSRDRENTGVTGTFYWGVSDKTDILLEAKYIDIDYDEASLDPNPTLDSEETYLLVGVEWEATGKTSGTVKLGVLNKDFDDGSREDYEDEFTWDIDIFFTPNDRHLISVGAAQLATEAVGTSNFINTEEYTAGWNFQVSDLTGIYANFRAANDKYEGSERDDDLLRFEAGVSRDVRRWFTIRASYVYDERDSNNAQLDYEKNVFLIGLDFSL